MSVNKVILIGNLGSDPETRYATSGDAITNIRLATTDRWRDKASGEQKEMTEWHRVVFFGKLAEIANQYLKKGSQVYVEGSIRTRKWTDKDRQERYTTEIRADQLQMLGRREGMGDGGNVMRHQESAPAARPAPSAPARSADPGDFGNFDDDVPF